MAFLSSPGKTGAVDPALRVDDCGVLGELDPGRERDTKREWLVVELVLGFSPWIRV